MNDNQSLIWIVLGIVVIAGILFAISESMEEPTSNNVAISESEK